MSENNLSITLRSGGAAVFPEDLVHDAQQLNGETMQDRRQDRLLLALALMTQKLAEAHRAELDELLERVKRLEEEARVVNASILDRREVAP